MNWKERKYKYSKQGIVMNVKVLRSMSLCENAGVMIIVVRQETTKMYDN